ncbi:hypothetical protein [Actinokineospora globicatena]|uniref:hypothetical protein n=1 Tax=Actinokineospora globicatena TaxID=103729 RepID=UPI0020A5380B|nr:hypothetical protein [Actinokineospora globicatena]MCP2303542.1 hypothetical protein [Actinokineospora globicatena]
MTSNITLGRLARLGVVVVTAVAGTLVAVGPAQAAPTLPSTGIKPIAWVGTDSRDPNRAITSGDVRIGSWKDDQGRKHTGKAYLTYDVAAFRDATLYSVKAFVPEVAAADCSKRRMTEVWETTPEDHSPTWADQPIERNILPGPKSTECVGRYLSWDATDAVQHALTRGDNTVTLAIRIAGDQEGNVAFGRTVSPQWATLGLQYNHTPDVPFEVTYAGQTCPAYVSGSTVEARARVVDKDGHAGLQTRWAFWPAAKPGQRTEVVQQGSWASQVSVPQALLVNNSKIAAAVRTEDGFAVSAWTPTCEFTYDNAAPAVAPTVSSDVYPEGWNSSGGTNVPGEFVFTANGVDDVVAFHYEGTGGLWGDIAADRPGGQAKITVTPQSWGYHSVSVSSTDRAGQRSPVRTYQFMVRETGPRLDRQARVDAGAATTFTLTANQPGAVAASYQLDNGPVTTVPLDADGTAPVTITVATVQPVFHDLTLWTTDGAGRKSGTVKATVFVNQAEPEIDVTPVEGIPGAERTITFTAARSDIASFTYQYNTPSSYGQEITLPAVNGTATATVAPGVAGWYEVTAFSTTTSGQRTGTAYEQFYVTSSAPEVTSAEYPENAVSGAPGKPGTFRLSVDGATDFIVNFEDRYYYPSAGPDGSATIELTPTSAGEKTLIVSAILTTWESTPLREYKFTVAAGD